MNGKFQEAFDSIHAEEALKARTKAFLEQKTNGYRPKKALPYYRLAPVMACFLFVLAGFWGYQLYFTQTSVISIDINPSVELGVNRFDRVVSAKAYNDDGEELLGSVEVNFKEYTQALDEILNSDIITDCLSRDEILSIAVVGSDETQSGRILSDVQACTAGQKNAFCYLASPEEMEEAHELGLSYGKYRAYLAMQEIDPDITPEEVQQMTMREIRDLLAASGDPDILQQFPGMQDGTSGQGGPGGQGPGQGPGWHGGKRKQQSAG